MTTKPFMYEGEPLTDERAERIAEETLAEIAAMSDEERRARIRPPGTLATRMGRPRLGDGESIQVRARLSPELSAQLKIVEARTGRRRSEIVRDALASYIAGRRWMPETPPETETPEPNPGRDEMIALYREMRAVNAQDSSGDDQAADVTVAAAKAAAANKARAEKAAPRKASARR